MERQTAAKKNRKQARERINDHGGPQISQIYTDVIMQRDPETFAIIGAAMEVHRQLRQGFLELVYQTALALEFQDRRIPYAAEVALPIKYKSKLLACAYRAEGAGPGTWRQPGASRAQVSVA